MKNEKLIHIMFDYSAAVQSKKDILSTEVDLLKINQKLKRYIEYRMKELEIKDRLERKLRAMKLDLGKVQNLMPVLQIPEILGEAHKKAQKERKAGGAVVEKERIFEKIIQPQ